jgi:hypothetical protein
LSIYSKILFLNKSDFQREWILSVVSRVKEIILDQVILEVTKKITRELI